MCSFPLTAQPSLFSSWAFFRLEAFPSRTRSAAGVRAARCGHSSTGNLAHHPPSRTAHSVVWTIHCYTQSFATSVAVAAAISETLGRAVALGATHESATDVHFAIGCQGKWWDDSSRGTGSDMDCGSGGDPNHFSS